MPGILICDDNATIRHLLRIFVEAQTPYKVCGEADNGTECIERAKTLHPDLILLDFSMPLLNGAEAAVILKKMMPQLKIILFSLHYDELPKQLAQTAGVDVTLSKGDGKGLREHIMALMPPSATDPPRGSNTKTATDIH